MKIRPIFAWYDFWIGVFYDRNKRVLYILPVPMCGIKVELRERTSVRQRETGE